MTKEEYLKRSIEEEDWAPGWDAIDNSFEVVYPEQEPNHYPVLLHKRAMMGGDNYLDGYSIYQSSDGYKHIVTYGMSELYAKPDAFGGEHSGWGYEMTMKVKADNDEDCMWAINILKNLANYTYTSRRFFGPNEIITGTGAPLKEGSDSMITAIMTVLDTEIKGVDTIHGRLEFIQLVGITQQEALRIESKPRKAKKKAQVLEKKMKRDNPMLVTDLSRKSSYF